MCDCSYDNPAEFYESQKRRARKAHQCDECLRVIRPGEEYEAVSGKWRDSGFGTFKTCEDCLPLLKMVDCFCHGYLMDDLHELDYWPPSVRAFFERRRANYDKLQFERIFLSDSKRRPTPEPSYFQKDKREIFQTQ